MPMVDSQSSEDKWEWDVTREQAFNALRLPDVCIFTGTAIDFRQMPLTRDAVQRAANHLYIEEEIARHERLVSMYDGDTDPTVGSLYPVKINVMTSLKPAYVWRVQDAINSGLDGDAHGVFTYVSSDNEANDDNANDNGHDNHEIAARVDDSDDNIPGNDVQGQDHHHDINPPSTDTALAVIPLTLDAFKNDPYKWVLDTGATQYKVKLVKD